MRVTPISSAFGLNIQTSRKPVNTSAIFADLIDKYAKKAGELNHKEQ